MGELQQNVYWIRKKVPKRYSALVRKTEVWRSLRTTDRRTANIRIGVVSDKLEREWAALAAKDSSEKPRLTHHDLYAIQRDIHIEIRDANKAEPGTGFAAMRLATRLGWDEHSSTADDQEQLDRSAVRNTDPRRRRATDRRSGREIQAVAH
ncbi:DUF6538 domain-containing protein [Bradyrhizobium pachyrhizi]|uniref:DUF6538 domain-containing protein n=1 Tax=Bradyrhizobium pachyrhizi TaxID=280333 RepID=UPI00067B82A2|nr:DUF6538 domain-containing protein [Bradyrhizobium pachyrhizi]